MTKEELKNKIQGVRTFRGKVMTKWQKRAKDNPQLHTKAHESVLSTSVQDSEGKELLFPRIRLRGPGLEKMDVHTAFKEAVKRKDGIKFDTIQEANEFGGEFSNALGRRNYVEKRRKDEN